MEISGKGVDICWLVKVRGHLDKVEKEQQRIKQKRLSNLSGNSSLKKTFLARKGYLIFQVILALKKFNEHLPHFLFKVDFLSYCSSQCPEFEDIYTLTTLNKTLNNRQKINNASQTCQDESGFSKALNTEDKRNEKLNSTENLSSCEKEGNALKENNIASQIGVRLEGKFVSKNAVNLSRRNLSAPEVSLLSKGLRLCLQLIK